MGDWSQGAIPKWLVAMVLGWAIGGSACGQASFNAARGWPGQFQPIEAAGATPPSGIANLLRGPNWSYRRITRSETVAVPQYRLASAPRPDRVGPATSLVGQRSALPSYSTGPSNVSVPGSGPHAAQGTVLVAQAGGQPPPATPVPPPPGTELPAAQPCPAPEPPDPFGPYPTPAGPPPRPLEWLPIPVQECSEVVAFAVVEGFELPGEDDHLSGRFGLNLGVPLTGDVSRLGAQVGGAVSAIGSDYQTFFTTGLFYRGDPRIGNAWSAGAVFDWLDGDLLDVDLAQLRAKVSMALDTQSELGAWGAVPLNKDRDSYGIEVNAIAQVNLFYRYLSADGKDMHLWVGWRDEPSTAAVGAEVDLPLDQTWAVSGGGHYGFTGDSWNAYIGLSLFFGSHAQKQYIGQFRSMPYLRVADHTRMTASRY